MSTQPTPSSPITVASLSDLRSAEAAIIARFSENQLAAQLFLVDPVRALAEIAVNVDQKAIVEWESMAPAPSEHRPTSRYDRMKALGVNGTLRVTISGVLPPAGLDVRAEDDAVARELSGFLQADPTAPPTVTPAPVRGGTTPPRTGLSQ